jgi:ATP-dependent Clp protease ATP-binding subunit ClpB
MSLRPVPPRLYEAALKLSVRGQEETMVEVAAALVKSVAGLSWAKLPKHTFLFLGPTGVGKTETAKTIAELVFQDRAALVTFDMGAYQTPEKVADFVRDFVQRVGPRQHQGCVILLDEIEKGARDLTTLLLAMLDEGRFSGDGEVVALEHCYLVATSNLGCAEIIDMKDSEMSTVRRFARNAGEGYFRPEVVARFKTVEVFRLLPQGVQREICGNFLSTYLPPIEERFGKRIGFDDDVVTYLIDKGCDDRLGARPLRNAIERHVGGALLDLHNLGPSVSLTVAEHHGIVASNHFDRNN